MEQDISTVQAYYESFAQGEWNRLYGFSFEFEVTRRMMARFLPGSGRILDIGGGPGRYSLYFAARGYDVTLIDLAAANVKLAAQTAKAQGLSLAALQGDARLLPDTPHALYDAVFLMGPLYHLLSETDRRAAIREARKKLKPGGLLFASFIGLFAGMSYYLSDCPERIGEEPQPAYFDFVRESRSWGGPAFTDAYFIAPAEIEPLLASEGFMKRCLFGQEGVAACNLAALSALPEESRNLWLDLCLRFCENPDYYALSSHLLYVGERTN